MGHYKWYQSQTSDDVSAFLLFSKGGRHVTVSQGRWPQRGGFGGGPISIGERNECQRER